MKMHSFLANLRIDSSLFTFFFALERYSRSIYGETKQYGLILTGLFQGCVGDKIVFHRVIRKQTAYALILLVCYYLLIGDYHAIVAWLLLFLQQQKS